MQTEQAVTALAALAQETRLDVYRLLVQAGPSGMAVSELGEAVGVAPATLSFHLKALAHAGLIAPRQLGRYIFYSADYAQMNALLGFLAENCCVADGAACCVPSVNSGTAAVPKGRAKARIQGLSS